MQATSRSWILFVVALGALLQSCASGRADLSRGEAGPIVWEIADVRQTVEERGNRMRWNYTLVLKNTGSTAVTFDQMTLITMTPGGNMSGGHTIRSYNRRVEPGSEMRDIGNSYSHGCVQSCDPQYVHQMLRNGVTRVIELRGKADGGPVVTPIIRLRLDSSVGMRVASVRELGRIAGTWRGSIYGPGSGPARVTIGDDGRYTWTGDRESGTGTVQVSGDGQVRFESSTGRRGSLTLYEGEGRRLLAIDYDGIDSKGELTPAE